MEFEWDEQNLRHILIDRPHGVTPELVAELALNEPKLLVDSRPNKSGSHLLIAPDNSGRFWTISVLHRGANLWRPITGWPSTNRQVRFYREG